MCREDEWRIDLGCTHAEVRRMERTSPAKTNASRRLAFIVALQISLVAFNAFVGAQEVLRCANAGHGAMAAIDRTHHRIARLVVAIENLPPPTRTTSYRDQRLRVLDHIEICDLRSTTTTPLELKPATSSTFMTA